jgi:phosphoglucomutase
MGRCGVAKEAYTVLSVASVGCFHPFQRIFLQVGHFGYNGSEYSGANFVREKEGLGAEEMEVVSF